MTIKDNNNAMDPTKLCVGIDLGTTNTSVSYSRMEMSGIVHSDDLQIRQKERGVQKTSETMPSILYRKTNGETVVGKEAQELKENSIRSVDAEIRYLENTKRYMGTDTTYKIDEHIYTPIEVATYILEHIKNYTDIKKWQGDYYTIITVPANFNTDQREDTLEAARKAGFKNVDLYDEPKAAILGFLHDQSQARENKVLDITTKKRIMVIDIGGGTCDISVEDVEERDGQYVFAHLAVGRENLGGVDFDKRIADDLTRKYLKGVKLTDAELASLRDMGQKIKENLSNQILSSCWDNYDEEYSSKLYDDPNWLDILEESLNEVQNSREIGGETIHFKMGIRELVNAINPLIYQGDAVVTNKDERERNKNMESLIENTLRDHDIDIDSIDYIFLTGGMAICFPLRAALNDIYGKPIISPKNPLLAVSHGAALINKYKSIDETSRDLMPNAIMIEMNNGRLKPLVKMGEEVPVTKDVEEVFKTTSRKGVVIRLYEGKNEFDCQLRRINNEYVIKTPELPPVGREFRIRYTVDKTKRLKLVIIFSDTLEEFEITGQIKEGK